MRNLKDEMMQRSSFYISLPLIISTALLGLGHRQAFAAESQAELATQLLARSQTLDTKCNFLASAEHDELTSLVARAELALAARTSVDATNQALARGRSQGQLATCTDSEKADINNILNSARQAANMVVPKVEVAAVQPAAKPKRTKLVEPVTAQPVKKPQAKLKSSLFQYASITEKYYLARRCGSMSSRKIQSLYSMVVDTHHTVLSNFGRAAVANVMQQSESKANEQSCG
jgi:hypothetical protein